MRELWSFWRTDCLESHLMTYFYQQTIALTTTTYCLRKLPWSLKCLFQERFLSRRITFEDRTLRQKKCHPQERSPGHITGQICPHVYQIDDNDSLRAVKKCLRSLSRLSKDVYGSHFPDCKVSVQKISPERCNWRKPTHTDLNLQVSILFT